MTIFPTKRGDPKALPEDWMFRDIPNYSYAVHQGQWYYKKVDRVSKIPSYNVPNHIRTQALIMGAL